MKMISHDSYIEIQSKFLSEKLRKKATYCWLDASIIDPIYYKLDLLKYILKI